MTGRPLAPLALCLLVLAIAPYAAARLERQAPTGTLRVVISPADLRASVTVTGPGGYRARLVRTRTLTGLRLGTYRVRAAAVSRGGKYLPNSALSTVSLTPSRRRAAVAVRYAAASARGSSLAIATRSLPAGARFQSYSARLTAEGGRPPYTWSLASGTLPPGLLLTRTGTIAGVPGRAAAPMLTLEVTDAAGQTARTRLVLTVDAPVGAVVVRVSGLEGEDPRKRWDFHLGYMPALRAITDQLRAAAVDAGLSDDELKRFVEGFFAADWREVFTTPPTSARPHLFGGQGGDLRFSAPAGVPFEVDSNASCKWTAASGVTTCTCPPKDVYTVSPGAAVVIPFAFVTRVHSGQVPLEAGCS